MDGCGLRSVRKEEGWMMHIRHRARLLQKELGEMTSPPVRYYGGKWRIAPWVISQFPKHDCYCEPFAGGASVLLRKPPSQFEVLNDINGDVVNFFRVLREYPAQLINAIRYTPVSRLEHRLAHHRRDEDTPVERARKFYVRSRQSFGSGEGRYNTGWRYQRNSSKGTSVVREWQNVRSLWAASDRLLDVQIECDDAIKTVTRFDAQGTLFYVDPPYPMSTRHSNAPRYWQEMTDADHVALAEALHEVEGMVIISSYPSPLYRDLYAGWRMVTKRTRTNGNNYRQECMWISPSIDESVWMMQEVE